MKLTEDPTYASQAEGPKEPDPSDDPGTDTNDEPEIEFED